MTAADYAAFLGYLAGITALGIYLRSRRADGSAEFFLAGRRMGWLPIGLSVMVTAFSAINYNAFPTEVFSNGLYVLASLPVFVLVALPVTRVFMPFYHSMSLVSAYEYLERRFDVRVRAVASAIFILWRVFWMAVALYAAGQILSAVTGLEVWVVVVVAGAAATFYTALGGMRAVMWTDVAQFLVLVVSILAAVALAAAKAPQGLSGIFETASDGGRLKPFAPFDPTFLSLDPRVRITLWSGFIGTFVMFLTRYGADQVVVQRYFSGRSLKDLRRGFWLNVASVTAALVLLALLGLVVYSHADRSGVLGTPGWKPYDYLAFLVRSLPAGVAGLVAAGLLAATMSSMDSAINSCAAAYVKDFHERLFSRSRPATLLFDALLTVVFAGVAVGLAFVVGNLGSLFVIVNKVVNAIGSPLLAVLLLGMFSRRVTADGMFVGSIVGTAFSLWVSLRVTSVALHYPAVINLIGTAAACHLASLLSRLWGAANSDEQLRWTWRSVRAASQMASKESETRL